MLTSAFVLFGLIYLSLAVTALSPGATAVFLFAMFRLAPVAKQVSDQLYAIDGNLPLLVAVHDRIGKLDAETESRSGTAAPPDDVETVAFEDVSFAYDDGTQVLDGVSLSLSRGELVALVGPSGQGKSTLVSLLLRFYDPDEGAVLADDVVTLVIAHRRASIANADRVYALADGEIAEVDAPEVGRPTDGD